MLIGYARISTPDQKLDLQIDALLKAGVEQDFIFAECVTGVRKKRPELDKMLNKLRKGDTVLVWKLDRLARNSKHLFDMIEKWNNEGIDFKSIQEPQIDSTSTMGKFMLTIFCGMAQLERDMIVERTKAGLKAAAKRGRKGGRKPGLSKAAKKKSKMARSLYVEGKCTIDEMCDTLELSRATVYKYLRHEGMEPDGATQRKVKHKLREI